MHSLKRFVFVRLWLNGWLTVSILFLCVPFGLAQESQQALKLNHKDRILILAPHPDDEAIGLSGVIQEALRLKIPVQIVYSTNGDNNELSFLVYKKRPILGRQGLIHMGEVRRKEAIAAMKFLGLHEKQLTFLGYPDFGTMNIFMSYWGETKPFKSMLTRVNSVPYKESFSDGEPYMGESILRDLKVLLLKYKPTKIFVSHPGDANRDHRALYLFLKVALWDLEKDLAYHPQVHLYLIHVVGWPKPRGLHPEVPLLAPEKVSVNGIKWYSFPLTKEAVEKKKRAISFYKSQIDYNPRYLYTFARANELFGIVPDIGITDSGKNPLNWDDLESRQNMIGRLSDNKDPKGRIIESLIYGRKDDFLFVKIRENKWADRLSKVNIYLFGYRNDMAFATMPKYRILVEWGKIIAIFDKKNRVQIKEAEAYFEGDDLVIQFPLSRLKNPQRILSSVSSRLVSYPMDMTTWHVLRME